MLNGICTCSFGLTQKNQKVRAVPMASGMGPLAAAGGHVARSFEEWV